nr:ribonuclease H-like domain-containing protein [Tanacetum cinerariifolium]
MSANDKFGLGYGDYRYGSILSYENEVLQSVFMNKASDLEDTPVNDRYADGMHAVPPPMIGNYMPSGPDVEIDYSKFTYGPKQTSVNESDSKPSEYASCESDFSVETSTSMFKLVENAPRLSVNLKCRLMLLSLRSMSQIDDPHRPLKDKGVVDSGCSRHMTGNKAYLVDYQEFKGGFVAFEGSNDKIAGKGKINDGRLDFEDVYYVEELKHYNLFSVSQMCDKKNSVFFTDTDYLVLSPDFKLPDEKQVLLKIHRQHNMYSFNLKNIDPSGDLACLFSKALIDESNKWHRRLGHVNFKNLNKLVKGNLVRGLPSNIFENDHTCSAYKKGKQHKASFGYSLNSKAFRVYNLETKRVEENMHVNFLENKPNVAGKGHAWMFDLDYLTNSMNYEPVLIENQANKSAGLKEANNSACTQANDDQCANLEEINLHEEHLYCLYGKKANDSAKTPRKKATHDIQNASTGITNLLNTISTPLSTAGPSRALNDGELLYPDDLMHRLEDIYASPSEGIFTDSSYDDEGVVTDLNNLETTVNVSPTPITRIHTINPKTQILRDHMSSVQTRSKVNKNFKAHAFKAIRTKWVYRNKKDEKGVVVRNKARLVSQGHRQEEWIDYDEDFAHVARIDAIRIFLAFDSYMGFIIYQMDVKSAFLYATINEEDKYVAEIVKKFDFLSVKTASTPIETQKPLVKDEEAADVDVSGLSQVEARLVEFKTQEIKFCEKIRGLEFNVESKNNRIERLTNELDELKKEKEGLDSKLIVMFPPPAQVYSPPKKDMSWTGLPEFIDATISDYSRPSPSIETDCPGVIKNNKTKTARKSPVKYAEKYRNTTKSLKGRIVGNKMLDIPTASYGDPLLVHFPTVSAIKCSKEFPLPVKDDLTARAFCYWHRWSGGDRVNLTYDSPLSGAHTSDRAKGSLNLEALYALCTNLSNRVLALETVKDAQAKEILTLKARIKKLEKRCKPSISHHKAWLRSVSLRSKESKLSKRKSVSKQRRKNAKSRPTKDDSDKLDVELDEDIEYTGTKEALNKGRQSIVDTAMPDVSTARLDVSTTRPDVSTARQELSTDGPTTTPTTSTIFDDEEMTLSDTLIKLKDDKAKGAAFKDLESTDKPARPILTLKPLPTIDLKDKGKGVLEEPESAKKMTKIRWTHEEQEKYSVDEREKLLAEYFKRRKKQLAEVRVSSIRNKPPTKTQLRRLMMTYLKNMGRFTHNLLNKKSFEDIQERRYPLTTRTLERMLSLRLIAESASDVAYDLLRFIQKHIDESGGHDRGKKD